MLPGSTVCYKQLRQWQWRCDMQSHWVANHEKSESQSANKRKKTAKKKHTASFWWISFQWQRKFFFSLRIRPECESIFVLCLRFLLSFLGYEFSLVGDWRLARLRNVTFIECSFNTSSKRRISLQIDVILVAKFYGRRQHATFVLRVMFFALKNTPESKKSMFLRFP